MAWVVVALPSVDSLGGMSVGALSDRSGCQISGRCVTRWRVGVGGGGVVWVVRGGGACGWFVA